MNYRIIGDSCMDLTEEQRKDPHFTLIPFTLMVEDHQFVDDKNFNQKEFLKIVKESRRLHARLRRHLRKLTAARRRMYLLLRSLPT